MLVIPVRWEDRTGAITVLFPIQFSWLEGGLNSWVVKRVVNLLLFNKYLLVHQADWREKGQILRMGFRWLQHRIKIFPIHTSFVLELIIYVESTVTSHLLKFGWNIFLISWETWRESRRKVTTSGKETCSRSLLNNYLNVFLILRCRLSFKYSIKLD